MQNAQTNPEHLVQTIEKISAIFERIKRGYVYEIEILCATLPLILDDLFAPSDILTKVIGEFLSLQQPHPKLLSKVVFQVNLNYFLFAPSTKLYHHIQAILRSVLKKIITPI